MDILMFNPFRKGKSRAAFQGKMVCPFCSKHADPTTTPIGFETNKTKIVLNARIGPFIREYKCLTCGGIWRYDIHREGRHPYESFTRGLNKQNLPGLKYSGPVPILNIEK